MSRARALRRRWRPGCAGLVVVLCGLFGAAAPAAAQRVVALAPLATLGSEDTSASARTIIAQLEQAVAELPNTTVLGAAQVSLAIKRAKRPGLAVCDGEPTCIVELGKLVGAGVVVTGQSGGLGEARVIYLSAVDLASGKELGSTTWAIGATIGSNGGTDSARAAIIRLLAPSRYTGTLTLTIDVKDATIYVNGRKRGTSAASSFSLPVGTHALRVTNPEYRDFVRFVDIGYGTATELAVNLQPLPVLQRDLARRRAAAAGPRRPWYRRWWVVAGGATVVAVVAGAIAYSYADNFDPDVTLP